MSSEFPPPSHLSSEARRRLGGGAAGQGSPTGQDVGTSPEAADRDEIGGIPVLWFGRDEGGRARDEVIVHIHGGSYVADDMQRAADYAAPIATRTGLPVVAVDYRVAPKHPCPAATLDCLAVYRELMADRTVRAVCGEEAGGGLAVAMMVALRAADDPMPDRLVLASPWVDLTCSADSYHTNLAADPDFESLDSPQANATAYAGSRITDPIASPLFADLYGLPPTLIQVGSREILLGDSTRLARALRAAGVSATLDVWDGLWPTWHRDGVPESTQAFDEMTAFLGEGAS